MPSKGNHIHPFTWRSLRSKGGGEARGERLGGGLDTCHIWDAGYDVAGDLDGVLREFDRILGLERLCAVHLNDSKNPRGSRKDRHEKLGLGMIGADALRAVVRHPLLQGLPFILETPNDDDGYRKEPLRGNRSLYAVSEGGINGYIIRVHLP